MNVMARLKYNFTWKKYHRWLGLVLSVFMLVFCVSGIILNHREVFSGCEVSRKWLPASYYIKNFNNGVVKGTVVKKSAAHSLSSENCDSVLVYGCAGVFLTDSRLSTWQDFNAGLPESIDERNVRHVVKAKDGSLWCAALRDVYRYDENSHRWKKVELPGNEERIMDVALAKDSMTVVALTRSRVFTIVPFVQYGEIVKIGKSSSETYRVESKIIPAPKNMSRRRRFSSSSGICTVASSSACLANSWSMPSPWCSSCCPLRASSFSSCLTASEERRNLQLRLG